MGQAAVDLPDPLDQEPSTVVGQEGVDDLLAQLAGDEIDRLLAEADEEAAPPATAGLTPIDAPVEPIQFEVKPGDTLDDVFGALPVAPPTFGRRPPPEVPPAATPAVPTAATARPPAAATPTRAPSNGSTMATPVESPEAAFTVTPEEAAALATEPAGAEFAAPASDDSSTVDAETQASLDALMSELEATAPVPPAAAAAPAAPVAAAPAPAPVAVDAPSPLTSGILPPGAVEKVLADEAAGLLGTKPPPVAEDDASTAAELSALSAGVDEELAQAAASKKPLAAAAAANAAVAAPAKPITSRDLNAVLGDADDEDAPLPFYLKPLEWLSAPLAACPPAVRDFVGKAAIITGMNAIAVLVYVMFFRK